MSNVSPRPTKNERREAAREHARSLREKQASTAKRKRMFLQIGSVLGVIALAVAFFFGYQSWTAEKVSASAGPANMLSDGFLIAPGGQHVATSAIAAGEEPVPTVQDGSGTVANIVMYIDHMCIYCAQFEAANAAQIRTLVTAGAASLEIFPLSFHGSSSDKTSNAFACVSDQQPAAAWQFSDNLFGAYSDATANGYSDDQIFDIMRQSGVNVDDKMKQCVRSNTFGDWVTAASTRSGSPIPNSSLDRISGTPTILVNGKLYEGSLTDPDEFSAFVVSATSVAYQGASPSPTP